MPEEKHDDDNVSVSSVESEWTICCEECGQEEHQQEENGQLLYGCVGVSLCSYCYPSAKAEHSDYDCGYEGDNESDA